jgi:hypothetical protein
MAGVLPHRLLPKTTSIKRLYANLLTDSSSGEPLELLEMTQGAEG